MKEGVMTKDTSREAAVPWVETTIPLAELERLLKVEAAARFLTEKPDMTTNGPRWDALRAALATDGAET